jgi:phenylacetate-CoA ligase
MNIRLKRLYDAAPGPIQSVMMNIVGSRTYSRKYGGGFKRATRELIDAENKTREELVDEQRVRVEQVLRHARSHVPYYRDRGCSEVDIETWPIIDRTIVASSAETFISDTHDYRRLRRQHSSGTTGTPLTICSDLAAYQTEMAFRWRHRAWAGIQFRARSAYLAGHPVVPSRQRKPPFWRRDHCENRLLLSSYHMSEETLPSYLDALGRFRPELLHGYPSSLVLLAHAAIQGGVEIRPAAIITASETLLEHQRDTIEEAFATKVFNWYGQTEMTCNIVECEMGGMHVRLDYGLLEVLPDGSMICTGLNNRAMPLIRYRTGDSVEVEARPCPCGRPFPTVGSVKGRVEDYVTTPEGYRIGRLDHLFKGAAGVVEAQIVQPDPETIILRVVRGRDYGAGSEAGIREEAVARLGSSVRLRFEYVPQIAREPSGKFRFVVSSVTQRSESVRRHVDVVRGTS